MQKKLNEIQHELKTQDNRITRDPIWIVYDWEKVVTTSDYTSDYVYSDRYDYDEYDGSKEGLMEFAKDNEITLPNNTMTEDEMFEHLEIQYDNTLSKFYYIKKQRLLNIFFTEKSANEFIERYRHHYKEPHTYVHALWEASDMKFVRDMILGGKLTVNEEGES